MAITTEVIEPERNNNEEKRPIKGFKEKEFVVRESLLTTLLRESEGRIVYNFLCAVFALFLLRALFDDIFNHGIPLYHTWLIWWNFAHFPQTMTVWSLMFVSTFIPYGAMKIWAHAPAKTIDKSNTFPLLIGYLIYLTAFFYYPLRFLFSYQLNCACSFIITCESTRLAMKVHSFIRENYSRSVRKKLEGEGTLKTTDWPSVEQFVYFMFCPSFIYRDEYPRCESRCWKTVGFHFLQCFVIIEFVNLVFTQYAHPWLSVLEYSELSTTATLLSLFAAIVPGILCLLCLFFGLLHCWLNAFSEMLQFADRQFYMNWWFSDNMAEYYRNWNLVVHDWLYAYVYRDVGKMIGGRKGLRIAQTCVFFLSAVFHEYWFGIAFRVFYPVMFLLYFVFGGIFFFVSRFIRNKAVWNVALWFNLLIGTGMFVAFYGQEWYARSRCLPFPNAVVDFLLPRHWSCHSK